MKVFVIGGTGFLGSHLVPELVKKGHEVTVLTRNKNHKKVIHEQGAKSLVGNIADINSFINQLSTQDMIILLAMPGVHPGRRIRKKAFRYLKKLTKIFYNNALHLGWKYDCPVILTQEASYITGEDEVADESWPVKRLGLARSKEDIDNVIANGKQAGIKTIQMLPAQIYGNGGVFKSVMVEWVAEGKFHIIGNGKNYIPRIHVEDLADAYVMAVEKQPVGEQFIIADDQACTVREFMNELAGQLNVKRPKNIPQFLVRLRMNKLLYEQTVMNCRVRNQHAKEVLGWSPQFPSYKEGLADTVKKIRAAEQKQSS